MSSTTGTTVAGVDVVCCDGVTLPQSLSAILSNVTGCGSVSAGTYDMDWDPTISNGAWVAYPTETFRVLIYCADIGTGSTKFYGQHQCFLNGQWRNAIGGDGFRELEGPTGVDQGYDCDPFHAYVFNFQVEKITYVNEFGFTVDDNCCGDVTTWTFDLEITE